MNRITKNDLQIKLDCINKTTKQASDYYGIEFNELELDYVSVYGGWQLINRNSTHVVKHRIPAKEMYQYLDGYFNSIIDQYTFRKLERNI